MQLDFVLLSFLIAFFRGGKLTDIPHFKKISLLVISILLQICSYFFPQWAGVLISISYLFILVFFYFNREFEDVRIFMIGWFLNALVIWANSGRMPVDDEIVNSLPKDKIENLINGTDFKHIVMNDETIFPFLGDILYFPYFLPRVLSIGDLFIMLGAFLMIQRIMNKPISLIRLREGNAND